MRGIILFVILSLALVSGQVVGDVDTIGPLPEGWEQEIEGNGSSPLGPPIWPAFPCCWYGDNENICAGAQVHAIGVAGNRLYTAQGNGCTGGTDIIAAYDISNPANITRTSGLYIGTDGQFVDLDIAGNYLYAVTSYGYLDVFKITPEIVSPPIARFRVCPIALRNIKIQGDYAFAMTYDSLIAISISDPGNPQRVENGAIRVVGGGTKNFKIQGNYLFIANGSSIRIVNIQNPSSMSIVATISTGNAWDIALDGDILYYVDATLNKIFSYEISNTSSPVFLDTLRCLAGMQPTGIALDGDIAIVTGNSGSCGIVARADIRNPRYILSFDWGTTPAGVFRSVIHGDWCYFSTRTNYIYSREMKYTLERSEYYVAYADTTPITYVKPWGDTIMCASEDGIWFFAISNPAIPVSGGIFSASGTLSNSKLVGLAVYDKYMYAVGANGRLYTFDITKPNRHDIQLVSNILVENSVTGIPAVHRKYLFVSGVNSEGKWRIYSYDISTPSSPIFVSWCDLSGACVTAGYYCGVIRIEGDTLYAGLKPNPYRDVSSGLQPEDRLIRVVNIENPARMTVLTNSMALTGASSDSGCHAVTFDIDGDQLYADLDTIIPLTTPTAKIHGYSLQNAGGPFPYLDSDPPYYDWGYQKFPGWADVTGNQFWHTRENRVYLTDVTDVSSLGTPTPIQEIRYEAYPNVITYLPHFVLHGEHMFIASWANISPTNRIGGLVSLPVYGIACPHCKKGSDEEKDAAIPRKPIVDVFPNPFNSSVTVEVFLPEENEFSLTIHDISGRLVNTLYEGVAAAGYHNFKWNGKDRSGFDVASGVYFFKVKYGTQADVKLVVLVK